MSSSLSRFTVLVATARAARVMRMSQTKARPGGDVTGAARTENTLTEEICDARES
jgi:hypothetical protein